MSRWGFPEWLQRNVLAAGWEKATEVQRAVVPLLSGVQGGWNVVGLARAGSGKTGAFVLPILASVQPSNPLPQAVIVTPTEWLSDQIYDVIHTLSGAVAVPSSGPVRALVVRQSAPLADQLARIQMGGSHILIGTVWGLYRLLSTRLNTPSATPPPALAPLWSCGIGAAVSILVFDEADQTLQDAKDIIAALPRTGAKRDRIVADLHANPANTPFGRASELFALLSHQHKAWAKSITSTTRKTTPPSSSAAEAEKLLSSSSSSSSPSSSTLSSSALSSSTPSSLPSPPPSTLSRVQLALFSATAGHDLEEGGALRRFLLAHAPLAPTAWFPAKLGEVGGGGGGGGGDFGGVGGIGGDFGGGEGVGVAYGRSVGEVDASVVLAVGGGEQFGNPNVRHFVRWIDTEEMEGLWEVFESEALVPEGKDARWFAEVQGKAHVLGELVGKLLSSLSSQVIVFANSKRRAASLAALLRSYHPCRGVLVEGAPGNRASAREHGPGVLRGVGEWHADMSLREQRRVLEALRKRTLRVVVASDTVGRGLDVPGIEVVVNADVPPDGATYVQRAGRAGRHANAGLVLTLAASFSPADRARVHMAQNAISGGEAKFASWTAATAEAEMAARGTSWAAEIEDLPTPPPQEQDGTKATPGIPPPGGW